MELVVRKCKNPRCTSVFKVSPNCNQKYCCKVCEQNNVAKGTDTVSLVHKKDPGGFFIPKYKNKTK